MPCKPALTSATFGLRLNGAPYSWGKLVDVASDPDQRIDIAQVFVCTPRHSMGLFAWRAKEACTYIGFFTR